MSAQRDPVVDFWRQCADPLFFFRHILGWLPTKAALRHGYTEGLTPDQQAVALSFRENRRTAVPSGHGNGKTKLGAGLALWALYTLPETIVVTTAPTANQVEKLLWGEIREAFAKASIDLPGKLQTTELKISDKWYATGISTRIDKVEESATRFQGFHAAGRVIVILDEATGVHPAIWEAASGITVGPNDRLLAIGNPTDPTAKFKEVCGNGMWTVIRMDCRNHPNVLHDDPRIIPGAVTKAWVDERLEEYGGEDTGLFRAKVAGLWPEQGDDMLISLAWVENAQKQWSRREGLPLSAGADIARFGSDETIITCIYANGHASTEHVARGQDTMTTAGAIKALWDTGIARLAVDDGGVGGGVTDRLREQGVLVQAIENGSRATDEERFTNRRAELWWTVREHLRAGDLALDPKDRRLAADLTNIKYGYDSRGRIKLESKDDVKKRLGRSPDRGDALTLAVWAWKDRVTTPSWEWSVVTG